ncbi:MAG: integrase repeat-containing protein [Patescibacteria group bacterium]
MINLFDYQQPALKAIIEAFREKTAALVVMATGLGKTILAAFWAQKEINIGHKGLFLCHNNGILDQAMVEFRKVLGKQVILKPFYGSNKDFDVDKANIVFASFQTYANWKGVFFENEFDFIIVDESHHGQAPTFKKVILYFKPKKLLGITATPNRMDLKDIREIFGKEVVNYTLEKAIAKGWLTQVEYHILNDDLDRWKLNGIVKNVLEKGERVSIKQLNESIFIKRRDEEVAKKIQKYAGTDKKTIIFCEKIEHAENFQRFLPNSLTYHSKVGEVENKRRLSALREGSLQYLLAVNKFNEGIDVPNVEVVVFLRCTDSRTIFYQQLGRGLRKILGKSKVIVLDFVANCERLAMVKEVVEKIKEQAGNNFVLDKNILHVTGKAFDFVFSDEQVGVLNLIRRINEPPYRTWQEASKAAIKLNIKSRVDHWKKYRADSKLPGYPVRFYVDFPGWYIFLGKPEKKFYPTWQEASRFARKIGISSITDYKQKRKQNPKLPAKPDAMYKDFPGWTVFLGNEFYGTWQEANMAAKRLGVVRRLEYIHRYKQDPKLPSAPHKAYRDFPGWTVFLGGKKKEIYATWKEAGDASRRMGTSKRSEYRQKCEKDPKLPLNPEYTYQDFPGWRIFLGGEKKEFYDTWQKASKVAIKMDVSSKLEYQRRYKQDRKLPCDPGKMYKDFPGWTVFLGRGFYETWQEASAAAIKLGLSSERKYRQKRKQDPKLPSSPYTMYKNFPSWRKFLRKE